MITSKEWFTSESVGYLSECLLACSNPQMLADLRSFVPAAALREAAKKLPNDHKKQIRAWVEHLNQLEVAA
ncbi:hypothetical protein NIES2101_34770 [Calothrix sp. HK-06]|nr:hypothetical protein NIES2101_34770 [Calothrix sp. HK-06]